MQEVMGKGNGIIGASLSEPHTSVTAFAEVVCITVDRENFAVKIISRSRPTAKIKHAKNKLRGDAQ